MLRGAAPTYIVISRISGWFGTIQMWEIGRTRQGAQNTLSAQKQEGKCIYTKMACCGTLENDLMEERGKITLEKKWM